MDTLIGIIVALIIVGVIINKKKLIDFSKEIKGVTNISFKGIVPRDEAIRYMLEADISISLSTGEGLPIAVLESMYSGCFTILSSIPPHIEISPPKKRCYFVNPSNQSEIINSLVYIQHNIVKIRSSRELSIEHSVKNFSVKKMLNEYREIYNLINNKNNI